MKKFFKILFSRFTLIFLAIVMQISLAAVILLYFNNYYVPIRIVTSVIAVLVLLGLINRDMNIEGKLPWAILVAAVPIVGVILYFSFSHNYASVRERKLFAKLPRHKLGEQEIEVPAALRGAHAPAGAATTRQEAVIRSAPDTETPADRGGCFLMPAAAPAFLPSSDQDRLDGR